MANKKIILGMIFLSNIILTSSSEYPKKTTVDIRVVRSPKITSIPYVLAPSYYDKMSTPIQTEETFAALLKQAQEALKGYDFDKVQQSAVYTQPKAITKPEVQYNAVAKPVQYKYVYANVPAVAYNALPQSESYHKQADYSHDHGSYHKFGYRVHDPHSGAAFGHSEVSEGHVTRGHYHVLLPDGRLQNVKYVADQDGYHATVSYDTQKYYLS